MPPCFNLQFSLHNPRFLCLIADYGPYGWIERFDPDFTPNTTDLPGRRYAFHAQPEVGQWNILQLARALLSTSLLTEEEAREGLRAYGVALTEAYHSSMAKKMGLKSFDPELTQDLTKEMYNDAADYTNTFRALSAVRAEPSTPGADDEMPAELAAALGPLEGERAAAWGAWLRRYRNALRAAGWASEDERRSVQDMANPAIIPRNHVLVGIIGEAEAGNYAPLERYMAAVQNPYSAEGLDPAWCEPGPKQVRLGVELLSCSS